MSSAGSDISASTPAGSAAAVDSIDVMEANEPEEDKIVEKKSAVLKSGRGADAADGSKDRKVQRDNLLKTVKTVKKMEFIKAAAMMDEIANFNNEDLITDKSQKTAAHYAASCADGEELLKKLVTSTNGKCLEASDENDCTPMHLSARHHSKEQFDQNLEVLSRKRRLTFFESSIKEQRLKLSDSNGETCLHYAAANGEHGARILASVLPIAPDCLLWRREDGASVLHVVVRHSPDLKKFIDECDPLKAAIRNHSKMTDDFNSTCIHWAAMNESPDQAILAAASAAFGDNPDCLTSKNLNKATPLHIAAVTCKNETMKKLLEFFDPIKIDFEKLKDSDGNTLLHKAASKDADESSTIFSLIDKFGGNPLLLRNNYGKCVLHVAFEMCSSNTIKRLLEAVGTSDSELVKQMLLSDLGGNTVAHAAARNCSSEALHIVREIRDSWDFLAWQNTAKQTVLHIAMKHYKDVEFLLHKKI